MARKLKLAINWAAACGGCDVAILDLEQAFLELAGKVELVYWPVALDFKRDHLRALAPGSVDVGLFNGAVRTSEQEEDAHLLRERCRVLVACGSCACFGGIPGLANTVEREALLATVYSETASTENPEQVRPLVEWGPLTLPAFSPSVRALHQVTGVDLFLPGCPPPAERLAELAGLLSRIADDAELPAKGTVLASARSLCEECPLRGTGPELPERFVRVHEVRPDGTRCLLGQGLACAGVATRGGCGASCVRVGMPCRGCLGPLPAQRDPAAELVSAVAALPGPRGNWEMPVHQIVSPARSLVDPLGTFYRFSYPVSPGRGTLRPADGKRGG